MEVRRIMRIVLTCVFLIGCLSASHLQVNPYFCYPEYLSIPDTIVKQYPFIRFDKNEFTFYSKPDSNWFNLAEKFHESHKQKNEPLHIYHFGGSHIQADIYTHDVRQYLLKKFSDNTAERGVVFPFGLGKTNNPAHYEFKSSATWKSYRNVTTFPEDLAFGIFGMTLVSEDSIIPVSFNYTEPQLGQVFTRATFLHQTGSFGYTIDSAYYPEIHQVITDTIMGNTTVYFREPQTRFSLKFNQTINSKSKFQWNGLLLEKDSAVFSYNAIGVNGASLPTYLSQTRLKQTLSIYKPDLCLLSIGTNDANVPVSDFDPQQYQSKLELLIQQIRLVNPACQFILTVPNDAYYQKKHPNKNIPRQQVVIHELAARYGFAVWDVYEVMGGQGSSLTWQKQGLMAKDFVHFTTKGYHLKGALLSDAFEKWLEQMNDEKER